MAEHVDTKALEGLSHALWYQRRLLDDLVYKLEVERLILACSNVSWLDMATADVAAVLDRIRHEELTRAMLSAQVARSVGLPIEFGLQELIDACSSPWDEIFRDHRAVLVTAVAAVEELSTQNRAYISAGLDDTRSFLLSLQGGQTEVAGYGPDGTKQRGDAGPAIFDSDI